MVINFNTIGKILIIFSFFLKTRTSLLNAKEIDNDKSSEIGMSNKRNVNNKENTSIKWRIEFMIENQVEEGQYYLRCTWGNIHNRQ
jgi:hypothetical protein